MVNSYTRTNTEETLQKTAVNLLSDDYIINLRNILKRRENIRGYIDRCDVLGAVCLYISAGLLIGSQSSSNTVLFSSVVFSSLHVGFVWSSKCWDRKERDLSDGICSIAHNVGFPPVVTPVVTPAVTPPVPLISFYSRALKPRSLAN